MEAKELRLNNLISWLDEIVPVDLISTEDINIRHKNSAVGWYTVGMNEVKGILLTEEWLLKFGFEKYKVWYDCELQKTGYRLTDSDEYLITQTDLGFELCVFGEFQDEFGTFGINAIKYVHQLQNLYFALTGQELNPL